MAIAPPAQPAAPPRTVVLDACVLMSGIVRPMLLRLAQQACFAPIWSTTIGHEWRRNAARVWKVEANVLDALWEQMQAQFPHADVGDATAHKAGLCYSDPKDWHVIAAARAALARGAQEPVCVLTWNLKDFNRSELRRLGLGVMDPDRLLAQLWGTHPDLLRAALAHVADDVQALGRPPEASASVLRRERLFRLQKLAGASLDAPQSFQIS